jgi:hypothetical protein
MADDAVRKMKNQLALDASVPGGAEISVTVRDLHVLVHGIAESTCPAVE